MRAGTAGGVGAGRTWAGQVHKQATEGRHRHAQRRSHHPQTYTGVAHDHSGGGGGQHHPSPWHSDALTHPYAVGDKEAGHLTHVHNPKCSGSHACPRTHTATHTVSHTWRLPNRQARPGTAPAVARPSHAESRGGAALHTGPESQVCGVSPTRTHTQTRLHTPEVSHKHPRHGPPQAGTLRHTQTMRLQAGRHTCGAFPRRCTPRNCGIIYLTPTQENKFHARQRSPSARILGQRPRGSGTCKPTVTLEDGLTKSHARAPSSGVTGGLTRTVTHADTRPHRDKLERHAGRVRTSRGHTDTHRDARTTPAHAHTTPGALAAGPASKASGGSRQAWRVRVSFSTVSGPTWSTRTPCGPSSRVGADMQASRGKAAASTVGPKRRADPQCARAPGELRPARGCQELQLPEGAALRPHSD